MTVRKIAWFHSLGFKGSMVLVAIAVGLLMGTLWVVNTYGKTMVLRESSNLLEEEGNHMVESLNVRQTEIAALARTVAATVEQQTKNVEGYKTFFPPIFDFNGDQKIAGGGIWPEPYEFTHDVDRRSFFWGRESDGGLKYYDDYNDPAGNGYHHEEWYVVGRYTKPGHGFWSKSYMDPYSLQPMVTYTVGTYQAERFTGTVTIDLKLESIAAFLKKWQKKTGGYAVVFDRNGKFIAFPNAVRQIKKTTTNSQGKQTKNFMTAAEFSKKVPLFQPIADQIESMSRYIMKKASAMDSYDASLAAKIDQDSYQINAPEASFIAAVIANPLLEKAAQSKLFKTIEIENDFLLQEKSMVFLFHVPGSYWKLAIVKPYSEATAVASGLVDTLLLNIGALILLLTGIGYFILRKYLVNPLSRTAVAAQHADALIKSGNIQALNHDTIQPPSADEIGLLAKVFRTMIETIVVREASLKTLNQELEARVEARTEELKNSEEYSYRLFSSTPVPLAISRVKDGSILRSNQAMKDFHQLADANISLVSTVDAYVYPNERKELLALVKNNGYVDAFELTFKRLGTGERRTCLVSAYPITYFGETVLLSSMVDITERKQIADDLVIAKQKAEEATLAKSSFLANMSHEIRTPMNAIVGLGQLLMMTELSAKQHDYLVKMDHSALSLLGIINDILDFSKIEAGKLDMEHVAFDLNDVLDHLSNMTALKASDKGLEFLIASKPDLNTDLIGDPLRLGQILINLTSNAVKFTAAGEITIRIDELACAEHDVKLSFTVTDTGIGMSEQQCNKLFQPFSQADCSTTRRYGGTGLGLSISKHLVELMNGDISVESVAGRGTSFHFTARFGRGESKLRKRQIIPNELAGMRVLIVDDNNTSCEILSGFIDAFGFEYQVAGSGAEAIAVLERASAESPYHLVLMDWKMAGMDGIEAGRRIKQHKTLKTVPSVIMVSAYGREELRQEAAEAGLDSYLVKPVNQSTLFDSIMLAFGKKLDHSPNRIGFKARVADHICGAQLLLVEDNEINQQVARELLEKVGLIVTIANNGQEGLDALEQGSFDGVLMDLQMPVMDGLVATREIRKQDKYRDLPIIAMTANVMAGDREACVEAGMNDHVAKPIDLVDLFAVLDRWIKASNPVALLDKGADVETELGGDMMIPPLTGVHVQDGIARVNGNKKLYLKILGDFNKGYAAAAVEIKTGLENGDYQSAERLAHTVKGLAGSIGADMLAKAASKLESSIVNHDVAMHQQLLEGFAKQLEIVMESLALLQPEQQATVQAIERKKDQGSISINACLNLLLKLEPCLQRRKPKDSKLVMEDIFKQTWPDALFQQVNELGALINSYKFKEAKAVLKLLAKSLSEQQQ